MYLDPAALALSDTPTELRSSLVDWTVGFHPEGAVPQQLQDL
jgi:hypothetical protein